MNGNAKKKSMAALLTLTMVMGSGSAACAGAGTYPEAELQEGGIWYELNVGTFFDSDGDGIGDFKGAEKKLGYLEELGVTGIWVQPINKSNASPYSTIDYYGLNASYGTMQELKSFLASAKEKGIRVVMDLVINHCAYNNPWFESALEGPVLEDGSKNKYFDWFNFVSKDANFVDKTALEIQEERNAYEKEHGNLDGWTEQYPMTGGTYSGDNANGRFESVWWTTDQLAEDSPYFGKEFDYTWIDIFQDNVPDLNFDNPEVRQEFIDCANFWLDLGFDGFRLDAARHIFGDYFSNIYSDEIFAKNMAFWQEFSEGVHAEHPDAYLIAEVWDKDASHMIPFITGGHLDSLYNFNLGSKMLMAAKNESTAYQYVEGEDALTDKTSNDLNLVEDLKAYYETCNAASDGNFIDCPFLSNHDQQRVMKQLEGNKDHARTAASLLAAMPGNVFLYFQEELGATESWNSDGPIKMPWTADMAVEGLSVEEAEAGVNPLYTYYKEVMNLKKSCDVLRDGDIDVYETEDQGIVSFIRMTQSESVLVLVNLTGEVKELDLAPSETYGEFTQILFQSTDDTQSSLEGSHVTINPYSLLVLE